MEIRLARLDAVIEIGVADVGAHHQHVDRQAHAMDSTMRSNLGVGLPIDVLVVRTDVCDADLNHRIEAGEPYFHDLRSRWSAALRAAHQNIPRPPYKTETRSQKH